MRLTFGILSGICVVGVIAMILICIFANISLQKDLGAVKGRVETAADADEMYALLQELDANMESRGMDSGYGSLWNHNKWTSIKEIRQNIGRMILRADEVRQMGNQSDEYQNGLIQIQESTQSINLHIYGWWLYNDNGWVFAFLLGPLFTLLAVGFGLVLLFGWDDFR